MTDLQSLHDVGYWNDEIKRYASQNLMKVLAGNKIDLTTRRVISHDDGQNMAQKWDIPDFIETSAKTGQNVEDAVSLLADQIFGNVIISTLRKKNPFAG